MNDKIHRRKIEAGNKLEYTITTDGYKEVLEPRIKKLLDEADRKCHPESSQFRVDVLKYHVGYYNGIKSILEEIELILQEKINAYNYLKDKGILDK